MNIVWFTWKDTSHPEAGGAENISNEIVKGLVKNGHNVKVITSRFPGSKKKEIRNGYEIIRVGNRYTVYWEAFRYYQKHLDDWTDEIIEEINTIPFMTQWYSRKRRTLLVYQLCREIWFYQLWFPLSLIGYLIEPVYLWLLRKNKVLTESESTKNDLQRYGFKKNRIHILPVFIDIKPPRSLPKKFANPTLLSFGSVRAMKRTLDQIKAFENARKVITNLKLIVAGEWNNAYGRKVKRYIEESSYSKDISFLGAVGKKNKSELFRSCHILLMTSIKEGWGLTVTEAASQGTPTIGYNIDGLRDSIKLSRGGNIVEPSVDEMSKAIIMLLSKYKEVNHFKLINSTALLTSENTFNTFKTAWRKNH